MRITAELSLYPLDADPIPVILRFIGGLGDRDDVEIVVNQMSTQLRGELDAVVGCVHAALQRSFESGRPQALVVKFLNSDLPIGTPPILDGVL
jgi:uncharacterized protein YqgV (UPF0045/DUF77 family)